MKKKLLLTGIFLLAAIAGLWTSIAFHHLNQVTSGNGRTFHYPIKFIAGLKNDTDAGKKVYQEYCAACHASRPLIAVRAPRLGHADDWQVYCDMKIKGLLAIVDRGVGVMPARGGCFECSDILLEKAIRYLLLMSHCA